MLNDIFHGLVGLYCLITVPFILIDCYYELTREEDNVEGNTWE